jgi:hypothetical protein
MIDTVAHTTAPRFDSHSHRPPPASLHVRAGAFLRRAVWLCALGAAACSVTETGNPGSQANFLISATTSASDTVSINGSAQTNVQAIWTTFKEVKLVEAANCENPDERSVQLSGPFTVDLVAQGLDLPFDGAGKTFCKVVIPLKKTEPPVTTTAPAALQGQSIAILGTYAGTPFVVTTDVEAQLEVRSAATAFTLDATTNNVLLAFDVARWFSAMDLSRAVATDGTLQIDKENNRELAEQFDSLLQDAIELVDDQEDAESDELD